MSKSRFKNLNDMLSSYKNNKMRFHIPMHKGKLKMFKNVSKFDITELSFSDNLFSPRDVILQMEQKIANIFNCKKSYVSTCGATACNLAVLKCFENQKILIERNAHISCFNAIEMFNITPQFILDKVSNKREILSKNKLEQALIENDKSQDKFVAVFLTYPNYYGECFDLQAIYELCKKYNVKLVLDASHGSHFQFSESLPASPTEFSDACVLSFHKTAMALTQSAVINCNDKLLSEKIKQNINMLHTTSPSYLLMASVDFSSTFMLQYYNKALNIFLKKIDKFKKRLFDSNSKIEVVRNSDPTRLVLNVSKTQKSAFYFQQMLENKNIFIEMCDFENLVLICSPFSDRKNLTRLAKELIKVEKMIGNEKVKIINFSVENAKKAINYNDFLKLNVETKQVTLKQSIGKISAQNVIIYPPSNLAIAKGEIISQQIVDVIECFLLRSADSVIGLKNNMIEVCDEERKTYNI